MKIRNEKINFKSYLDMAQVSTTWKEIAKGKRKKAKKGNKEKRGENWFVVRKKDQLRHAHITYYVLVLVEVVGMYL